MTFDELYLATVEHDDLLENFGTVGLYTIYHTREFVYFVKDNKVYGWCECVDNELVYNSLVEYK
jgi:hypothetical protein